jgi:hypothetical protein
MALTPQEAAERLKNIQQELNTAKQLAEIYDSMSGILEEQNRSISSFMNSQKRINTLKNQDKNLTDLINKGNKEYNKLYSALTANGRQLLREEEERLDILKQQIKAYENTKVLQNVELEQLKQNGNYLKAMGNELKDQITSWAKQEFGVRAIWSYLQEFDGAVKKYQLSLGAAGEKADMIRQQTENSVNASARFGANIKDVVELQSGLNDLTGKSNVFREKDILDLVAITKGTGMQNEEVTKLVGNMMLFGSSIGDAKDLVQRTVNDTSKMGLNSSKVMKSLSMNIDKMDSYRFQGGVDGLKKMVMASEKFRFSMEGALAAADKFRTLEGLLEAGATLRVLGGEFAKMDEFKLSFLARNKPEEFAVEMAKLTKGMATFNKETGTFDITDVDFDKLRVLADSTGRSLDDVVKSTRQLNQMEFAKKQIFAGTDEEKEMIAKLATFKKGSSMGFIQIGDKNVNLNELTKSQISLYVQQQKTLEERAKDSQTFNETFNNTIMQLKSALLPLLQYVNKGLEKFNSMLDAFRDGTSKLSALSILLPVGGLLFGKTAISAIVGLTGSLVGGLGKLITGGIGGAFRMLTTGISSLIGLAPAAGAAAVTLLELGGAIALIGAGVGVAGYGLGKMFEGINNKSTSFTGLEALGNVDFNNIDKLKVLQDFKQSDIDKMEEMFNILNQINSIDTSKLSALQSIFSNMSLKFTLDGDAVLKSTVNVDFGGQFGDKLTKFVDQRVPIAMKKGLGAK